MSKSQFCSNLVFYHIECTCKEHLKRTPLEGLMIVFLGIIQKV
jgi:hypothetical protein